MEKLANAMRPIHDLPRKRWSPLPFSDRRVEPEKLLSVFGAARRAPSSFNAQPLNFLVAAKGEPAEFERLHGCLVEFNRRWAQRAPSL